ncbi:uncharacterized protein LOC120155745 [Hibiscus syriacus]|uniref:uncharacterized protein LOC120155745 n=1 Tax=Hibiscus syriacus TaxID=106335 RepID=UPI001921973C|nr:uncharacterized protein LOC120155745 [Hibiscus syriacus]
MNNQLENVEKEKGVADGSLSGDKEQKKVEGIRQGDPLSSYIFVLVMEKLGHNILQKVAPGSWKPFQHDLILYSKADLDQARIVVSTLSEFGHFSGHRVSSRKTRIYFSPNTSEEQQLAICAFLGYHQVDNMGKYLGVPIFHGCTHHAHNDFILDKMRARLNGWAARTLSMVGRITLANRCNGESLSSTENLSFHRTYDHNTAFIWKLGYALITRPNAFWVQAIRQKYRMTDHCPSSISMSCCSPLCRALTQTWNIFRSNILWLPGNGNTVHLWDDCWIPTMGPLCHYLSPSQVNTPTGFADLIDQDGNWNSDKLAQLLNLPLLTVEGTLGTVDTKWKAIWTTPLPQRICLFLWLILKERILTNKEIYRRGSP